MFIATGTIPPTFTTAFLAIHQHNMHRSKHGSVATMQGNTAN